MGQPEYFTPPPPLRGVEEIYSVQPGYFTAPLGGAGDLKGGKQNTLQTTLRAAGGIYKVHLKYVSTWSRYIFCTSKVGRN